MFDCNARINVAGTFPCKFQQLDLLQLGLQHLDSHKNKIEIAVNRFTFVSVENDKCNFPQGVKI